MEKLLTIFDLMDSWRHLPSYQLERRADLFFALYLREAVESKLSMPISPLILPEFPVHIGSLDIRPLSDMSFKIDYVLVSSDGRTSVFVELKTDTLSRNAGQDQYLEAARAAGFKKLLEGIVRIFMVSRSKGKYFHLLETLEKMGHLRLPAELHALMDGKARRGATRLAGGIEITTKVSDCTILYVQPKGAEPNVISFREFADTVRQTRTPLSDRFSESLLRWASNEAGSRTGQASA